MTARLESRKRPSPVLLNSKTSPIDAEDLHLGLAAKHAHLAGAIAYMDCVQCAVEGVPFLQAKQRISEQSKAAALFAWSIEHSQTVPKHNTVPPSSRASALFLAMLH